MGLSTAMAIVGWCMCLVGFGLAAVQSLRLNDSRRMHQFLVWKAIRAIRTQLVLFEASKRVEEKDPDLYSAYRVNMEIYRDLLSQAVSLERKFGPGTLLRWYQVGKLGSRFELEQACHFLRTEQIGVDSPDVQKLAQLLGREAIREAQEKLPDYMNQGSARHEFN